MTLTVFYAWQSDRDRDLNYHFIRRAAQSALEQLKSGGEVEDAPDVQLDHDTKGVAGTPHIADTIRQKIDACSIFLADVTHVADYAAADGRAKRAQNPNVLIELGMAVRAHGTNRIILIQNEAFGGPEDLPFDLRHHRFPIRYRLSDPKDRNRAEVLRSLTERLKSAFHPILDEAGLATRKAQEQTSAALHASALANAKATRTAFEAALTDGRYNEFNLRGMTGDLRQLEVRPLLALSVFPTAPLPAKLDLGSIYREVGSAIRPIFARGWERDIFVRSMAFHATKVRPFGIGDLEFKLTSSFVEVTDEGCLFAAEELLPPDTEHSPLAPALVDFYHEEREVVTRLCEYLQMLRSVSDPHRSFLIGFSLLCPAGVRLKLRKHAGLRPIRDNVVCDFIQLGPQEIPSASDDARRLISRTLRPAFDAVWRAAGLVADPYYDAEGTLPFDLVTS